MRVLRLMAIGSFGVMAVASGLGACRDLRAADEDRAVYPTEGSGTEPFGAPPASAEGDRVVTRTAPVR